VMGMRQALRRSTTQNMKGNCAPRLLKRHVRLVTVVTGVGSGSTRVASPVALRRSNLRVEVLLSSFNSIDDSHLHVVISASCC
jgi:hypothetical protein